MKRLLLALLLNVSFATSVAAAAEVMLAAGESRSFEVLGATAAWPVDAGVVEVSASAGRITLFARAAGRTGVMIMTVTGERRIEVTVKGRAAAAPRATVRPATAAAEVRYSSATRELQNSVTVRNERPKELTEVHVRTLHQNDVRAGYAETSVANAWVRIFRRGRELTLLDQDVEHSPLTLSSTPLRGIHYRDERWRLHAGYTAYATYRSLLIPVERRFVAGGGYAFDRGNGTRITPSLFGYSGEKVVASLLYETSRSGLDLRTEIAGGSGLGGALQLAYDTLSDHAQADIRYRSDDFPSVDPTPRGLFGDASWTRSYASRSSFSLSASGSDAAATSVISGTAALDHHVRGPVFFTAGISAGKFGAVETAVVPAGVRIETPRVGFSALYRHSESTRGDGAGFRVASRLSSGPWFISAFVDRQENTPTLDVIFAERPDLAVALEDLGISATTPADIARALREHAVLAELGFIDGVTVELAPVRRQYGFEAALRGSSRSRQELRARLLHSDVESVSGGFAQTLATLTWSRGIGRSSDVYASISRWRVERGGEESATQRDFVEVGVRQRFDDLGAITGGRGTISGTVFIDEDFDGSSDGQGVEAVVQLDGTREVTTGGDGRFSFDGVPHGMHRLSVKLPDRPGAFFTTASQVEVETGEKVAFGVATVPARLVGRVVSDAGAGIASVHLLLSRGQQQLDEVTRSDGSFEFAAPPGEWQLSVFAESVPAGYSMKDASARRVTLARAEPQQVSIALRAIRSISGSGAKPNAVVEVRPEGRSVTADESGRFSIRSLSPGELILASGGVSRLVVVPTGPSTIPVDLGAGAPAVRSAAQAAVDRSWVVQLGAYRVPENAAGAAARARESGIEAHLRERGALTIVEAGPFTNRRDAAAAAGKLTSRGLEAVVAYVR